MTIHVLRISASVGLTNNVTFADAYTGEGRGPACTNGELYGLSQPLLQLIAPLIETPVWRSLHAFASSFVSVSNVHDRVTILLFSSNTFAHNRCRRMLISI